MKYYLIIAGALMVACAAYYYSKPDSALTADQARAEWKRHAVEAETKVRPPHFEDMKYNAGAEMRMPASQTK